MTAPIQSLMNMEMALYGGMGSDCNVPSFSNNYMGNSSWNSFGSYPNYFMPNYGNVSFGQQIPYGYANGTQQNVPTTQGLDKKSVEALGNFYADNMDPSQSLFNAVVVGGVSGALMMNPRVIAHPINTYKAFGDVKKMFGDAKVPGTKMHELWSKNNVLMEEAYSQMHRTAARAQSKLGAIRGSYTSEQYKQLKGIMEQAIKSGKPEEIAKATETLRHAQVNNGWLATPARKGWHKVSGFLAKVPVIGGFFGKGNAPVFDPITASKNTKVISENAKTLLEYNKMSGKGITKGLAKGASKGTLKIAFKKAGGKLGLLFAGFEILTNLPKIFAAKEQDKVNAQNGQKTNLAGTQTKQTVVKATANAAGWLAGETLGVWGAAKLGAKIGTKFGPGIGTVIGAVAGFVGGSLGMRALGGLAKKKMGTDVADKETGKQLAQTTEGQVELAQMVMQKVQNGEKVSADAMAATQQIINNLQAQQQYA